jgi:hypothetical protein
MPHWIDADARFAGQEEISQVEIWCSGLETGRM